MGTTRKRRRVSDAATSNAGDDFHLVWAARRCLELLEPGGTLTGLLPENPASSDATQLDPTGAALLAIDLAEYHGGNRFEAATRVVYSQLKYSTKSPHAQWTASAMTRGKKSGPSGSFIDRMAHLFKSHIQRFERKHVLDKLCLRLVSNRPIAANVDTALRDARAHLDDGSQRSWAWLKKQVNKASISVIEELRRAGSALSTEDFCDFLRVLDVSSRTGELSRVELELALAAEIGTHGFAETSDQRNELLGRFRTVELLTV